MKKNLVPLLGIAFLVAIAATGLFYGLVSSQLSAKTESPAISGEPSSKAADTHSTVPAGMRAVSVQVADSSGVLLELKPGGKVDVQAVVTKSSTEAELRTILENISVFRMSEKPEAAPGRPALPVVTLLTTPEQADILGLADAAARIRLVLRNPQDNALASHTTVSLTSILTAPSKAR